MIHVAEAKRRMMQAANALPAEIIPLAQAAGRFNLHDVVAPFDHPLFDCSAMDGYAFAFAEEVHQWTVVAEAAAGDAPARPLAKGECVRIFTGAMLPPGADTVVMQERVLREGNAVTHSDAKLRRGANVRPKGDQLRAGEVALPAGSMLNAAAIGLLASVGVAQVAVAKRPRVALLISGDEFADGGTPGPGKIFGSNAMMLEAALGEAAIAARAVHVGDDHQALVSAWNALQRDHDVIISTGGVSVGDHDLIPPSLAAIGADIRFHGVMQKPGKPMLFGLLGGTAVFGLPGNPRAVMVLFLEYVLPFLRARQGCAAPWMRSDLLPIAGNVEVKGSRAEFRAARVFKGCVQLLADEGSHMLRTLAVANAIAFLPMDQRQWHHGDHVEVHYLD